MRIAVVSDIHGNLPALEAVVEDLSTVDPKLVVQGGDLALGGAQPAEVVDRVRELRWPGVVGNTDELLWRPDELETQVSRAPKLRNLLRLIFDSHAPATRELLGAERIDWMRELPAEWRNEELVLVHASPGDLWRAPMPEADAAALTGVYGGLGTSVAVYGHIHQPYVRVLEGLTVANSGSVGMPADGDPRASYLLIEDGVPEVRRVEYDVERAVGALLASDYPDAAWTAERIRTGRNVKPPAVG